VGRNTIFFFRELWKNLSRNPLMTAAAASTSVLSLITLGMSLVFVYNINNLSVEIMSQVEIRAFLDKSLSNVGISDLREKIMKLPQVKRIEYIDPGSALDKLQEDLNINLNMAPEENPLPPALVIHVSDPRQIGVVADKIKQLDGVEELQYGEKIIQSILALNLVIKFVGYSLTMLMAIGALFTIMNTIRLTLIARRQEIRTMQLVGATSWFIRWPFLLEGATLGLIGALLSTLMLAVGYFIVSAKIQASLPFIFPLVPYGEMSRSLFWILLLAGSVMGYTGSYISISRFLQEPFKD
jgi:cell division transport system permease protein